MQTIKSVINKIFISSLIMVQIVFYPAATFAVEGDSQTQPADGTTTTQSSEEPAPTNTSSTQEPTTAETESTGTESQAQTQTESQPTSTETSSNTTDSSTQGPTSPTGADGDTYTYNEETGKWENDYYSWDPETKQTTPKQQQEYSYNPETGRWDTTEWQYNPATNSYEPNTVSTDTNPNPAAATSTQTSPDSDPAFAAMLAGFVGPDGNVSTFNGFYNTRISNQITSLAVSGNASVLQNNTAGNAVTGNALAMANLINLLQSSWNPTNGSLTTFISNIDGDVVGDLHIDPGVIARQNLAVGDAERNVDINIDSNNLIDNRINLVAQSGDATVEANRKAGYAHTGSAAAMANVVNIINSSISSGDSFFGVLNIRGNLDGDILLPDDFMANLLASNAPRTTIDTTKLGNSTELVDITNKNIIRNNITTNAESGDALIDQNTIVDGRAITGNASTNITVFNLTGQSIVGGNALLVFVNVMGEWVGVITNAPAGSTAAALGNGSVTASPVGGDSETTINNKSTINNDIFVSASSGDATVRRNTIAGNAQTGDATAGVNLLNISNSQFSFGDWFGVLFINVLGKWNGSFGIDTVAGSRKPIVPPLLTGAGANKETESGIRDVRVFRFVPSGGDSGNTSIERISTDTLAAAGGASSGSSGLSDSAASSVLGNNDDVETSLPENIATESAGRNWNVTIISGLVGLGLLGLEPLLNIRKRRKLN